MKKICSLRMEQIIQEWNKKDRIQKYAADFSNVKPKVNRVVKMDTHLMRMTHQTHHGFSPT